MNAADNETKTSSRKARAPKREERAQAAGPRAVEPNSLEFELAPAKATEIAESEERAPKARRRKSAKTETIRPADVPASATSRAAAIPDAVRERFIQIGTQFYFPDGAEAFADHGRRMTTRSENAVVIQSMVAIAQERGATTLKVSGTDFFKKEAWFAGQLAGLEVTGYVPSALEQERLVRAISRRRSSDPAETAELAPPSSNQARASSGADSRPDPNRRDELIVGRLVDHGPAPYQHKAGQAASYYVRIETPRGDREVWGVDLERAFRQSLSTPGLGDEVGLRSIGRESVKVLAPRRDADGNEVALQEIGTHRNQWLVEKREFLHRRAQMADVFRNTAVNAAEATKRFPELEGSYLQLQMARAGAAERVASSEAREQFVDHLRAHLAKTIEYGQPLQPVHLKTRGERVPDRVHDRELAPGR